MLGKWFGSMKQLSTDRVRSRQKPFSFVRLALGYIPILLHGNKKTCVYPRTRTWRLTILTTFLVSWQQSAILQAKWWIQMNTGSGDRLVKILFLPPGELRSCYSHSCWWTFAPRSLMCSHPTAPSHSQAPLAGRVTAVTWNVTEETWGEEDSDAFNLPDAVAGGETEARIQAFEHQLLELRNTHKNTDHPEIAVVLHNLGNLSRHAGDLKQSEQYCRDSLRMKRSLYKHEYHPEIAVTLNELGNLRWQAGDLQQAKQCYDESLQMKRSLHGDGDHPEIAVTLCMRWAIWVGGLEISIKRSSTAMSPCKWSAPCIKTQITIRFLWRWMSSVIWAGRLEISLKRSSTSMSPCEWSALCMGTGITVRLLWHCMRWATWVGRLEISIKRSSTSMSPWEWSDPCTVTGITLTLLRRCMIWGTWVGRLEISSKQRNTWMIAWEWFAPYMETGITLTLLQHCMSWATWVGRPEISLKRSSTSMSPCKWTALFTGTGTTLTCTLLERSVSWATWVERLEISGRRIGITLRLLWHAVTSDAATWVETAWPRAALNKRCGAEWLDPLMRKLCKRAQFWRAGWVTDVLGVVYHGAIQYVVFSFVCIVSSTGHWFFFSFSVCLKDEVTSRSDLLCCFLAVACCRHVVFVLFV